MVNAERSVTKPQMPPETHSSISDLKETEYKPLNPQPRPVSAPNVPLATGRRREGRAKAQRWCNILKLDGRIEMELRMQPSLEHGTSVPGGARLGLVFSDAYCSVLTSPKAARISLVMKPLPVLGCRESPLRD